MKIDVSLQYRSEHNHTNDVQMYTKNGVKTIAETGYRVYR